MHETMSYYSQQVPGLGDIFMNTLKTVVQDVAEHPYRWPIIRQNIHRRLIHRFPYGILYRIEEDAIVIIAITHLRRRPSYWIERIRGG